MLFGMLWLSPLWISCPMLKCIKHINPVDADVSIWFLLSEELKESFKMNSLRKACTELLGASRQWFRGGGLLDGKNLGIEYRALFEFWVSISKIMLITLEDTSLSFLFPSYLIFFFLFYLLLSWSFHSP